MTALAVLPGGWHSFLNRIRLRKPELETGFAER